MQIIFTFPNSAGTWENIKTCFSCRNNNHAARAPFSKHRRPTRSIRVAIRRGCTPNKGLHLPDRLSVPPAEDRDGKKIKIERTPADLYHTRGHNLENTKAASLQDKGKGRAAISSKISHLTLPAGRSVVRHCLLLRPCLFR